MKMEFSIVVSSTNKQGLEDKLIVLTEEETDLRQNIMRHIESRMKTIPWYRRWKPEVYSAVFSQAMSKEIEEFKRKTIKL